MILNSSRFQGRCGHLFTPMTVSGLVRTELQSNFTLPVSTFNSVINLLFLTFDNGFSGITYNLFGGKQNIFLTIFSTKFVIKCAANKLKIG